MMIGLAAHTGQSQSGRQWWHLLPSLLMVVGIAYLSLIREVPFAVMEDVPLADKWGHAVAYMLLALCIAGDLYRMRLRVFVLYVVAFLFPVAYGGLMEWLQLYFPPRMCESADWLADVIGAVVGVVLFALFHLCKTKLRSHDSAG